jgi:hypothetical protein
VYKKHWFLPSPPLPTPVLPVCIPLRTQKHTCLKMSSPTLEPFCDISAHKLQSLYCPQFLRIKKWQWLLFKGPKLGSQKMGHPLATQFGVRSTWSSRTIKGFRFFKRAQSPPVIFATMLYFNRGMFQSWDLHSRDQCWGRTLSNVLPLLFKTVRTKCGDETWQPCMLGLKMCSGFIGYKMTQFDGYL